MVPTRGADLYISVHQDLKLPPTLETEQLLLLLRDMPLVEDAMKYLADISVDAVYYAHPDREPASETGKAQRKNQSWWPWRKSR